MSSKEIYVSTDVEADGPIPGPNRLGFEADKQCMLDHG
jgi:hypothetical protein